MVAVVDFHINEHSHPNPQPIDNPMHGHSCILERERKRAKARDKSKFQKSEQKNSIQFMRWPAKTKASFIFKHTTKNS